ncbi:ATP-binding protein, partial [Phaeobacter sp. SYSU ZJ3003]|uniref:ATP-binding protein n=1 Tax=Phaeobacter sp. SYSU ZJ3003 TaxID=2109330 RepID=UPI00351C0205
RSLETGGHGLGLSIARTIIQAHGGNITLRNRETGGLRAIVTIPLAGETPDERRER